MIRKACIIFVVFMFLLTIAYVSFAMPRAIRPGRFVGLRRIVACQFGAVRLDDDGAFRPASHRSMFHQTQNLCLDISVHISFRFVYRHDIVTVQLLLVPVMRLASLG